MNTRLASRFYRLTLTAAGLLFVLIAWGQLSAASSTDANMNLSAGTIVRTAIYLIPLALPLWGIVKRNRQTYRWATLCVLPYFVVALTEAFANSAVRTWATLLLAASIFWFFSLIGYLRVSGPSIEPSPN